MSDLQAIDWNQAGRLELVVVVSNVESLKGGPWVVVVEVVVVGGSKNNKREDGDVSDDEYDIV
jgi:hypothetical protein